MKIVCIATLFFDYVIQLANSLSERGEEVILMLPCGVPEVYLENISKRVRLYLFKHPRRMYQPTILATVFEIRKQINSFNPDLVHIQVSGILPCLLPPLVKRYPMVATFHDIKPHIGSRNQWFFRFVLYCARRSAAQYIVHGQRVKEELVRLHNVPGSKVNVVTIGEHEVATFKKYESPDIKEEGNLILFFGTIWEYKGLDYLIKAEPLITKELPNVKIVIAGRGEDFSKYQAMMVNRENFIVHNYNIPFSEGASLFQRSSIVVLPYIDASQTGVIPLSYGFGKPVVVTSVGSVPEIVDEGVTGLIVPTRDPKALADAIVRLMKDETLRKQMGANAYKKLKTDLSWDRIAERTIEVYRKAAKRGEAR